MTAQSADMCVEHCRFEEKHAQQDRINVEQKQTNEILHSKLNRIDGKLNWIIGGVAVGWPLVMLILHLLGRVKP